jgi:predicted RNase H-like nuclease (RuvC/YqgF family)
MIDSLFELIAAVALQGATAVVSWRIGRRKTRAEVAGMDINNLHSVLKIYRETIADLEGLRDELKAEAAKLRNENRELNATLLKAQHENRELRANLDRLQRMLTTETA